MHPVLDLMLSPRGRLRRRTFWAAALLAGLTFAALFTLLESTFGRASTLMLYPPFFWCAFGLSVKRLHDGAASGWWLLAAVVPVLGPLWLLWLLALKPGTAGENQFGDDPRTAGADYLTVSIGS